MDVRIVEGRVHVVEHAERAGPVVEDREEQGQSRERPLPAGHERHSLEALTPRLRHQFDAQLQGVFFALLGRHHAELGAPALEEPLEDLGEVPVDLVERFLETLLRGAGHATQRPVEIPHGLNEVVVLAPEELQALLQLSVLVIRDEVDRAHALELGRELFVARLHGLDVSRGVMRSEEQVGALDGVAAAGILEQLFPSHAHFRLPEAGPVDARAPGIRRAVGPAHLPFLRLPVVEAPAVLFGEHSHVTLLGVALRAHLARALVRAGLLAAEILAPLEELRAPARCLLEARSALVPDLAQAVDLPAQGLDALEHRGEVDTAGRDLADNGRLACLIGFEAAPEGRHLPLDIALARRHLGHPRLESLELLARGGRLRDELPPFRPQRLEVAPYPIGLAPGRLDVLLAGETRGLLRMDGYLQHLLAGPE